MTVSGQRFLKTSDGGICISGSNSALKNLNQAHVILDTVMIETLNLCARSLSNSPKRILIKTIINS
jgi:hypothetical protein